MTDCCLTSMENNSFPKKHICPSNGLEYRRVTTKTIKHHIIAPWNWVSKDQGYYFCSDPDCPVVYFAQDNSVIEKTAIRSHSNALIDTSVPLICFCYGVTKPETSNPQIKQFVMQETKQNRCSCDSRNPSGQCCLNQFPKE